MSSESHGKFYGKLIKILMMTKSFKLLSRLDGQTPCQEECTVLSDVMALVPYVWLSSPGGVCVELSLFSVKKI